MNAQEETIKTIYENCGALQKGHFKLRSGLHSEWFFQCARIGEDMETVTQLASLMLETVTEPFSTVLAPAMGALVIGQEVARQAKARFIFPEKKDDMLVLRRGFKIHPDERILIVEDVVTRGGRAQESIDIVKAHEGIPVAVAVLVDRSGGEAQFKVPFYSLMKMDFPTYDPNDLPEHLKDKPLDKPGS